MMSLTFRFINRILRYGKSKLRVSFAELCGYGIPPIIRVAHRAD